MTFGRNVPPDLAALGAWLTQRSTGMPQFGSLGGMYSAVAEQIFGNAMEAGKVMGLGNDCALTLLANGYGVNPSFCNAHAASCGANFSKACMRRAVPGKLPVA